MTFTNESMGHVSKRRPLDVQTSSCLIHFLYRPIIPFVADSRSRIKILSQMLKGLVFKTVTDVKRSHKILSQMLKGLVFKTVTDV